MFYVFRKSEYSNQILRKYMMPCIDTIYNEYFSRRWSGLKISY